MKNRKLIVFIILSFTGINAVAQTGGLGMINLKTTSIEHGSGVPFNTINRAHENVKTLGSQYEDATFKEAYVNNGNETFKLRYNNYQDVFEYQKSNTETLAIDKSQYHTISFKDGKSYYLKKYTINGNEKENYLLSLGNYNSKNKIFKLSQMEYIPYKEITNSYEKGNDPEYKLKKAIYFVEIDGHLKSFDQAKDLLKIFPQHKDEIKRIFYNQKNITDQEVIRFQTYLNK